MPEIIAWTPDMRREALREWFDKHADAIYALSGGNWAKNRMWEDDIKISFERLITQGVEGSLISLREENERLRQALWAAEHKEPNDA